MRTKQQIESFVAGLPLVFSICGGAVFARITYGAWQGRACVKVDDYHEFDRAAIDSAEAEVRENLSAQLWDVAQVVAGVPDDA